MKKTFLDDEREREENTKNREFKKNLSSFPNFFLLANYLDCSKHFCDVLHENQNFFLLSVANSRQEFNAFWILIKMFACKQSEFS